MNSKKAYKIGVSRYTADILSGWSRIKNTKDVIEGDEGDLVTLGRRLGIWDLS